LFLRSKRLADAGIDGVVRKELKRFLWSFGITIWDEKLWYVTEFRLQKI